MGYSKFADLLHHYQPTYVRSGKKGKQTILEILVDLTGYDRKYLIRTLASPVSLKEKVIHRHKHSKYERVMKQTKELWVFGKFPCSRRFKAMIPIYIDALSRFGEIKVTKEDKKLILQMSESTMDRQLKVARKNLKIKARTGTKPGTLLKAQIPIKMWTDWDHTKPGFFEIDSVHHNGGNPSGHYCYTVSQEDVATGWHENTAHLGKSEVYTSKAIEDGGNRFPFLVLGLDFDTGGEFVNWHLKRYCDRKKITYTRARQGVKNDQCYVEETNWSQVREYVGYARYDTDYQCELLNKLYLVMSDYLNYFQAKERCTFKERNGARVKRKFETRTPYQRVMAHPDIPQSTKDLLTKHFLTLNPKQLLRDIVRLQKLLDQTTTK